jgi:protein-S-isoprenylcysteine O-methyltransferase Ste14
MHMSLDTIERQVRWIGGVAILATLGSILWGLERGLHRPRGRTTGLARTVLRGPAYLAIGAGYSGLCFKLWRPIPLALPKVTQGVALLLGSLLYFPGLALVLWGRVVLGEMYNVSSGFGVQLYSGHRLITHGPYTIVRHPMYVGILLAGLGGLLIYRTWTFMVVVATFVGLIRRARREEQALAAEFGEEWAAYRRSVPAWIPGTPAV